LKNHAARLKPDALTQILPFKIFTARLASMKDYNSFIPRVWGGHCCPLFFNNVILS